MSDSDNSEIKRAKAELHAAMNKLREANGEPPLPFVPGEPPFCSFCGRARNEVRAMIAGPAVDICDQCVAEASRIIQDGELPSST